jgi:hypothetical protein
VFLRASFQVLSRFRIPRGRDGGNQLDYLLGSAIVLNICCEDSVVVDGVDRTDGPARRHQCVQEQCAAVARRDPVTRIAMTDHGVAIVDCDRIRGGPPGGSVLI